VSGSADKTLRVWDLESRRTVATLEGHTGSVYGVAVSPDGRRAVSASGDGTLRVWDLESGRSIATFSGHIGIVIGVAVSPDGLRAVSASADKTLRVWDLPPLEPATGVARGARYTNAKVVLVGDSGVGKTGLAIRLAEDRWEVTESTHGLRVSRLHLPAAPSQPGVEREIWLWDFAGQPDYRLVNQLSMDETALALFVFNPQDDNPFNALGFWDKAIDAAAKHKPAKVLVAGRCDRGGVIVSRKKLDEFRKQHGLAAFLQTAAKSGKGCDDLKDVIARHIPWDRLPWTATTQLFKSLKEAIVEIKAKSADDETQPSVVRLAELRQRLQLMRPGEDFTEAELRAVVGLLEGQGLIKALAFGDFVLLHPERVNGYAAAVVRVAREHTDEMGSVLEYDVLDGRIDFKDMLRLPQAEEALILRAVVQTFLDRSLCLRQETQAGEMLVFPSYFNRDKPEVVEHPNVFVTYGFSGPLDEIYSTLVVRLHYTEPFKMKDLWKNAADFETTEGKRVGLKMDNKGEGKAELVAYFAPGVPDDTKVSFIKYTHEHLLKKGKDVTRVRCYVCPYCDEPVESVKAVQKRLEMGLKDIACAFCGKLVSLVDAIEVKFGSDEFRERVRIMDEQAETKLDNESLELILVGHAKAIAGEAGQIFRETPNSDWGIDGEIEFKNHKGQASGRRLYLQLKSGDSYLRRRKRDDREVFQIKPRHVEYWQAHAYDVMLVVRTSDGRIRWMNATDYLRKQPKAKPPTQIEFEGEPFSALNLIRMRDRLIPPPAGR
jgi:small GTP-binding protein